MSNPNDDDDVIVLSDSTDEGDNIPQVDNEDELVSPIAINDDDNVPVVVVDGSCEIDDKKTTELTELLPITPPQPAVETETTENNQLFEAPINSTDSVLIDEEVSTMCSSQMSDEKKLVHIDNLKDMLFRVQEFVEQLGAAEIDFDDENSSYIKRDKLQFKAMKIIKELKRLGCGDEFRDPQKTFGMKIRFHTITENSQFNDLLSKFINRRDPQCYSLNYCIPNFADVFEIAQKVFPEKSEADLIIFAKPVFITVQKVMRNHRLNYERDTLFSYYQPDDDEPSTSNGTTSNSNINRECDSPPEEAFTSGEVNKRLVEMETKFREKLEAESLGVVPTDENKSPLHKEESQANDGGHEDDEEEEESEDDDIEESIEASECSSDEKLVALDSADDTLDFDDIGPKRIKLDKSGE